MAASSVETGFRGQQRDAVAWLDTSKRTHAHDRAVAAERDALWRCPGAVWVEKAPCQLTGADLVAQGEGRLEYAGMRCVHVVARTFHAQEACLLRR